MDVKRFKLMENTREISYKDRLEIKAGCALDQADQEPAAIKAFGSKAEALEVLKEYKTEIRELSGSAGSYYSVTEYYIQESELDDEGDLLSCDIWGFSRIEIELVEKPSYSIIGTFGSYEEAEKAYNDYEGENEVYITF